MNWLVRFLIRYLPEPVIQQLPEDRAQLALDRGRRADVLMADETFTEAFGEIEARLTEQWRKSADASHEQREALFRQVAALQSVRGQLKAWSEDAKFIAARIEKAQR